jgi:arginine repressor
MSGIKGFSSSLKNIKPPKAHPQAITEQQFATLTPTGYDKHGLDVVLKAHYPLNALPTTIDAIQPTEDADRILFVTGHGLRKGDMVRFAAGSSLEGIESEVIARPDANTIVLATKLPSVPVAGTDTVELLRGVTLRTGADGSLVATSGPLQYLRDGVATQVAKDTVTPANTRALPVEIVASDGAVIEVTAGDINVQLQHDGANPDSTRIGDGTNLAAVDVNNRLQVLDEPSRALLASLDGKDFATQTTLAALLTAFNAEDFATQTTLEAARVLLASIDGKDFATQTTLAALLTELQAKADLTETQPVSAAALPLPAGASTEAKQDSAITVLGNLLTELQAKADLTETQPVSLASQPLPTGAATEATLEAARVLLASLDGKDFATQTTLAALLTAFNAEDFASQTTLAALLTELQAKADLTETQPVKINTADGAASGRVTGNGAAQAISAPANAQKVWLQAEVGNAETAKVTIGGTAPSATIGYELLPGASVEIEVGADVNFFLASGNALNYIWTTRS